MPFVVIETNENAIEDAADAGYLVVQGDATNDAILKEAGLDRAWHPRRLGLRLRQHLHRPHRKSLAPGYLRRRPRGPRRERRANAPRRRRPRVLALHHCRAPDGSLGDAAGRLEFIDTLGPHVAGAPVLAEIDVSEGSGLSGRSVADVLHGCKSVVVLGLQKESGALTVAPALTTALEQGDRIIVMGQEDELEGIRPNRRQMTLEHAPPGTA